jgi:hypothetical protein
MADTKISALPASTTPLAGTEVLPIVQSSTTKQVSVANLTAGRAVNALSATLSSLTSGRVPYATTSGLLTDSANLTFDGTTLTTVNVTAGVRNNITSTNRISVTGATTIFSIATSGSSVGASGAVVLVNGYDTGTTTNSFIDLILFVQGVTPVVVSTTNRGIPAVRTYTASGTALQLAMATGTYNVASSSTEQAC